MNQTELEGIDCVSLLSLPPYGFPVRREGGRGGGGNDGRTVAMATTGMLGGAACVCSWVKFFQISDVRPEREDERAVTTLNAGS